MKLVSTGNEISPYISSYEEFFLVPELLKKLDTEHCYSETFDNNLIDLACYNSYFPMSGLVDEDQWALILKLHKERCIIDFDEFKTSKKIKRLSQNYTLTFNKDFDKCIEMINARYEHSWLSKPLVHSFKNMKNNPDKYATTFASFELWDGDTLVAGEVGFIVGSCYSSLSGFHTVSNTGHIQLYLTNLFLKEHGFGFWDLGMELDYKLKMGGKIITEEEFLERYSVTRDCGVELMKL